MSEEDRNFVDESINSSVGVFNTVKNFVGSKKESLTNYLQEKKVSETASYYYESAKDKAYHLFTDHPRSKNMTYWQHLFGSMMYFMYSFGATLSFLFHGVFPFMFETRGSQLTSALYSKLMTDGIILECDNTCDGCDGRDGSDEADNEEEGDGESEQGQDRDDESVKENEPKEEDVSNTNNEDQIAEMEF